VTGNGRIQNPDLTWADSNDGLDTLSFGGGPTGPTPQLKAPNGVPLISFGAPAAETGLSIQLKHISLKRITPGPIVARIDANSGITFRYGSALTYGELLAPIGSPVGPVNPNATDQISRFNETSMTHLTINAREPNAGEGPNRGYQYRFNIRGGPSAEEFDGTTATMNIRAKLLPSNTATSLSITAKDLDGNDNGAGTGADEYRYDLPLNLFNTSTFTTISVPLTSFTLATFTPSPDQNPPNHVNSTGPFGFQNAGDGLRTNFNLYEFGAGVVAGAGLLRMELEFMELRLPPTTIPGDHNNDGVVDQADFVAWKKNPTAFGGDPDGYNTWRTNFGSGSAGSGGGRGAVPEPAAWLLVSLAAAVFGIGRRRVR
jgi:hypothetical protein